MTSARIPSRLVAESVDLEFDESIYSLDVVQRAGIKFTHLASIAINRLGPGRLAVRIAPFHDADITSDELAKVFVNEVLDHALRARIYDQTAVERNLILSYTFSRSRLALDNVE